MTFQIIINVFDNEMKSTYEDRITASTIVELAARLQFRLIQMQQKLHEEEVKSYEIGEDDDIPF